MSGKIKKILLIRHAEPDFPGGVPICMGQRFDLPLSFAGREQARTLAENFPDLPLEAVYTSPLHRCLETAQPLAERFSLSPIPMRDLAELRGGVLDGLPLQTMHERYPHCFAAGERQTPPGGESDAEGLSRMEQALAYILEKTEHCAAVISHSAINRIWLSHLLKLLGKTRLRQEYAHITPLLWQNGNWTVGPVSLSAAEYAAYERKTRP